MFKSRGFLIALLGSIATLFVIAIIDEFNETTLFIVIVFMISVFANLFNVLNKDKAIANKKYGYHRRDEEDVYFDTRTKTLKKNVIFDLIDEDQEKYQEELERGQNNE